MTWSLASYTANGTQGFGVLREDGTLVAPTELKRWSSTLDLLDPGAFTFLAPDASSYASTLRRHPVAGVRLREIRRQEIADRHTWDRIFPAPATAGLLIRPDGVICWRAQSSHPDPALVVRAARARALHSKT